MNLKFTQADFTRVAGFYLFYSCFLVILAWPFCLPSGRCENLFEWLWDPYLAGNSTIRFAFVVGFEYFVSLMAVLLVRLKPEQTDEEPDHENQEFIHKIGVIIPCHKSAEVIATTLEHALHHFPPENIVVMDNGRSESPMDSCLEEVRKVSPDIHYRWVPIGLKCLSLLLGSRILPDTVEYVLLIDDDVLIPRTMRFDSSYFDDENVSAVAYPIGGCGYDNTPGTMNLIQKFQDLEFKLSDTYRAFQSQYSTITFAHGAVGLWRRSRFMEIYSQHPGLPIGEDGWAGRLNLMAGYEMKHDSGPIFRTEVPPKLVPNHWYDWAVRLWRWFGFLPPDSPGQSHGESIATGYCSADLFNQRARRWDMNAPRRVWCHVKLFFCYGWDQYDKLPFFRALWYNIVFRLTIFRGWWAMFKVLIGLAYLVYIIIYSDAVWVITLLGAIYVIQILKYTFVNYFVWRKRKDLQVGLLVLFLMPFYRKMLIVFRFYGNTRSALLYMPIVKAPDKVLGDRDELHDVWPGVRDQTDASFTTEVETSSISSISGDSRSEQELPRVEPEFLYDIELGGDHHHFEGKARPLVPHDPIKIVEGDSTEETESTSLLYSSDPSSSSDSSKSSYMDSGASSLSSGPFDDDEASQGLDSTARRSVIKKVSFVRRRPTRIGIARTTQL